MSSNHLLLKGSILCSSLLLFGGFILFRSGELHLPGVGSDAMLAPVYVDSVTIDSVVTGREIVLRDSAEMEIRVVVEEEFIAILDSVVGRAPSSDSTHIYMISRLNSVIDSLRAADSLEEHYAMMRAMSSKSVQA